MMAPGAFGAEIGGLGTVLLGLVLLWKGQQLAWRFGSPVHATTTIRFLLIIGGCTLGCGALIVVSLLSLLLTPGR